jgi:hypothetical protein
MIAPADPIGAAMSIEAKNAILEHLGRQHQAMVALLADLVNIYSGRYNKRGVDAVGHRLRVWLDAAGISCETFPHEAFGRRTDYDLGRTVNVGLAQGGTAVDTVAERATAAMCKESRRCLAGETEPSVIGCKQLGRSGGCQAVGPIRRL